MKVASYNQGQWRTVCAESPHNHRPGALAARMSRTGVEWCQSDLSTESGQGHYTNDNGMRLTLFTPAGLIAYGETKAATIAEGGLSGFIFSAKFGRPTPSYVEKFPPRDLKHRAVWPPSRNRSVGRPKNCHEWNQPQTVSTWRAPRDGEYFALLRVFGDSSADIELNLECPECDTPTCVLETACNLYCPGGVVADNETGCLGCACRGATCPSTGCRNDDFCMFPCGRNLCKDGQTCIDGRCEDGQDLCGDEPCEVGLACVDGECIAAAFECTDPVSACEQRCPNETNLVCGRSDAGMSTFDNACMAECNGFSNLTSGRCEDQCSQNNPCPEGQRCEAGQCRPAGCQCDDAVQMPVCGASGRTHASPCRAECAGDAVAYPGPCRENRCENQSDCRFDEVCVGVRIGAEAQRRACDPEVDADCALECRPLPRCNSNRGCPQRPLGLGCYPVTANEGICLPTCDAATPDADPCPLNQCAAVLHRRGRQVSTAGLCLPSCEVDAQCPGNLKCLPDLKGRRTCQTCACDDFPRSEPVCTERGRFENVCFALCAGLGVNASTSEETAEVCDGADNDCDGRTDEGLGDVREECNGRDDDCDGQIDERIGRRVCGDVMDLCEAGFEMCRGGQWSECIRAIEPSPEQCDGEDNDCDGNTDEGLDGVPELCDGQDNDCDGSTDEGFENQQEICDGLDNDCDGRIDESNDPCPNGRPCRDANRGPLTRACQNDGDNPRCGRGEQQCIGGEWGPCGGLQAPMVEVCDDQDNDCDGRIDEEPDANGQGPDGAVCREPADPCAACPFEWSPVCTDSGVVYSNECEAACRVDNAMLLPLERCYRIDQPFVRRCAADDDCAEFGRGNLLCLNVDTNADALSQVDADLSQRAQCLASTGECGCNGGQCGFRPTEQTRRCFQLMPEGVID